ncbi:hypothetical protein DL93DRAFT_2168137 [Clavulina sp. PMI_390]|nr:hypothetical protein DL93DRAFT_2168137 [Clavulina sp. PMI_390]
MVHINTLPAELIQAVFEMVPLEPIVIGDPVCFIDSVPHRRHLSMPLTLSYVCGQWRSITLSTGLLWSSIVVLYGDSTPREISILSWQLALAGNWPLTVRIDMTDYTDHTIESLSWKFILNYLPQCESFTFPNLPTAIYTKMFPLHGVFPRLRKVFVHLPPSFFPMAPRHSIPRAGIFEAPSSAPSLQVLHMDNPWMHMLDAAPLSGLTYIHFSLLAVGAYSSLYELMKQCTSLVYLHLPIPLSGNPMPYPPSPLVFPRLECLSIQDCDLDQLVQSPSLQTLECSSYRGEIDSSHIPFIRLLRLTLPEDVEPSKFVWDPPAWTRDVETLTLGVTPTNLSIVLCARQESLGVSLTSEAAPQFLHLPCLKSLILESRGFPLTPTQARDAVRALTTILEARTSLHVRALGNLSYLGGNQLADLSARLGGRVSKDD